MTLLRKTQTLGTASVEPFYVSNSGHSHSQSGASPRKLTVSALFWAFFFHFTTPVKDHNLNLLIICTRGKKERMHAERPS